MQYDVVIAGFRLNAGEPPAKALERLLGLSASEAKALTRRFPAVVIGGTTHEHARRMVELLGEAGAKVELRESVPGAAVSPAASPVVSPAPAAVPAAAASAQVPATASRAAAMAAPASAPAAVAGMAAAAAVAPLAALQRTPDASPVGAPGLAASVPSRPQAALDPVSSYAHTLYATAAPANDAARKAPDTSAQLATDVAAQLARRAAVAPAISVRPASFASGWDGESDGGFSRKAESTRPQAPRISADELGEIPMPVFGSELDAVLAAPATGSVAAAWAEAAPQPQKPVGPPTHDEDGFILGLRTFEDDIVPDAKDSRVSDDAAWNEIQRGAAMRTPAALNKPSKDVVLPIMPTVAATDPPEEEEKKSSRLGFFLLRGLLALSFLLFASLVVGAIGKSNREEARMEAVRARASAVAGAKAGAKAGGVKGDGQDAAGDKAGATGSAVVSGRAGALKKVPLHPLLQLVPKGLKPVMAGVLRMRVQGMVNVAVELDDPAVLDVTCVLVEHKAGRTEQRLDAIRKTGNPVEISPKMEEQLREHIEVMRTAQNDPKLEFTPLCLSI